MGKAQPKIERQISLRSQPSEPVEGLVEIDPWTAWAYQPHTVTFLFVGVVILVYASGALWVEEQNYAATFNYRRGVLAMVIVYLGYSLLQAPDTDLIRPHPALWRLVHGVAVVYLIALTFMLFQNVDDARHLLKHLSPELGVELEERSYGTDCRIYTPEKPNKFQNVYETLFDEFVIAHILGWYCKAITLRNNGLIWTLSILFELGEVTFNHMLPNFNECWWDSIILDVFLCNWLGIWAGMCTVRYFEGQRYSWVGISKQPTLRGKLKRVAGQFFPASWDKDGLDPLSGPRRFVLSTALVVVFLTVELNAFFLKFCLWVPPRNPLNTYRLLVWWLIANPAVREYNKLVQSGGTIKMGAFCWLAAANCLIEVLICIKFGRGLYPNPMPSYVKVGWSMAAVLYVLFVSGWAISQDWHHKSGKSAPKQE